MNVRRLAAATTVSLVTAGALALGATPAQADTGWDVTKTGGTSSTADTGWDLNDTGWDLNSNDTGWDLG